MKLSDTLTTTVCALAAGLLLPGCNGLFDGVYDEPDEAPVRTVAGQLYVDASDWYKWHYIDLPAVADSVQSDSLFNPSSAWVSYDIPEEPVDSPSGKAGLYVYWYDVFGAGISNYEFREYIPTAPQEAPESWTIAVHRNNVRTNGCMVAETGMTSLDDIPEDKSFLSALTFEPDRWSETEVWCQQERMLIGIIGNQGIEINAVLSSWLEIDIPPVPPSFAINSNVMIIRLSDNTYAAVQLVDYISPQGTKCCLTINYRYPI